MALYGQPWYTGYLDGSAWNGHPDQMRTTQQGAGHLHASADYGVPYGYAFDCSPPQQYILDDDELLTLIKNRAAKSAAAKQNMEPNGLPYTQALQIAALESLTKALDCSQLPADEAHLVQQPSTGYAYCPGGHCLHPRSLCLDLPASLSSHPHAHRSVSPRGHEADSLMMDAALRRHTFTDMKTNDTHWTGANWHSKTNTQACQQAPPTKGTGVFLPCTYDEPEPILHRSSSDVSNASKDDASSSSGDMRRVVGSKVGAKPSRGTCQQ
ncbi:MAG: hypothetical protein FRX49_05708 [Trebouxia sp. A1-2]|nr:MAG: hypothetical protein FRX49_05708 [Trebouxia sp. A1-2]